MRVNDERAYTLRRSDYGDTSLLVDLFTRDYGRLRVVAKGARSGKSQRARVLQPFLSLTVGWSGRSELKTLTQVEGGTGLYFGKEPLACAFYLNELLWHFLEVFDAHEALFDSYEQALQRLATEASVEPILRNFEFLLFQDIGYGMSFDVEADTGEPVLPEQRYLFQLEKGLVRAPDSEKGVSGALFLAIENRDFVDRSVLALAKQLSRQIIHHRLEGRELNSRKWFSDRKNAQGSRLV